MRHFNLFLLLLFLLSQKAEARGVRFGIDAGPYDRHDCAMSINLADLGLEQMRHPRLYEIREGSRLPVPCQLVGADSAQQLCFILSGQTRAHEKRVFLLSDSKRKEKAQPVMTVRDTREALVVEQNGRPVLSYRYTLAPVPEGVDSVFRRSGFIHPAWTPSGFVLTAIQPRDHRHHYGIWNPWTRVEYDGRMYDLWNLGDRSGTVRATGIGATYEGPVVAGFDAPLDHVIFPSTGEQTILKEQWLVRAWQTDEGFLWDFESRLMPCTSLPVLIKEYRYAGFGYRANEVWTRKNCLMMTSEGHSRQQIDGTRARWIYITGDSPAGRSSLLFLGAPQNYNAPEPLRIWNEEANGGRGDAFINFAPTKNADWQLQPGQTYRLRYRQLACDEEMTPQRAEQLWRDYACPPVIEILKP